MTNLTKISLSAIAIILLSGCGDTVVNQTPSDVNIGTGSIVPIEPEPIIPTTPAGAIHSDNTVGIDTVSFENVVLNGTSTEARFTGESADALEAKFNAGIGNAIDATSATQVIVTPSVLPVPVTSVCTTPSDVELLGDLTGCTLLTADKEWILDGLVVVTSGSELWIEAGTTIRGNAGTGDATSYLIVNKDAKIMAQGTAEKPITFTSVDDTQEVGLWGGLTIIGNAGNDQVNAYEVNSEFVAGESNMADNSGVLTYVKILNSGITMEQDKEINGLSLVGVGSGTVIDNIIVNHSDDDCIEAWGGTVNMSNITVSNCTDDQFDIDDGYSGTVTNLKITQTIGNAAMEMSGITAATFNGLTIVQNASAKEGVVFFKGAGVGGHFKNATITDNVD